MSEGYSYFSIVFTLLLFIVTLTFAVHAAKSFCGDASDKLKNRPQNGITKILCFLSLGFMCSCMFICIFIACAPFISPEHEFIIQFTGYITFNIGVGFVFSLFFHSLYVSFKNSAFRYHPWLISGFTIFTWFFLIFLILFDSYAFFVDFSVYHSRFYIYYPFQYFIHFALLILFNRNLVFVAKISFINSEKENVEQNRKIKKLLDLVIRHTILVWYITITGALVLTLSLCSSLGIMFGLTPQAFSGLFWIFQYMDCTSMAVCVYLKMGFATKSYNVACKYPHNCCFSCIQKCVQNIWSNELNLIKCVEVSNTNNTTAISTSNDPKSTTTTSDETHDVADDTEKV